MSSGTPITSPSTFRNETPYPFCPGCGHGPILDHLNQALVKLGRDPSQVVIVSDIGCSGLSDQYFVTSVFHGLHGRSITYATGIKLARPELEVVVIMGDGGTGIGGAHLLSAARRNIGITVLVMNNMNFGMTGGQHSTTTPSGAMTSTTPGGNLERPLDICATVGVNGAAWAWRGTGFDRDLADRIAEGMRVPGFALLDVWEMCTAYFVPQNKLSRKSLLEILDRHGFETGVVARNAAPEYASAYREAHADDSSHPASKPRGVDAAFPARLERRFSLVAAGSAGGKVRSAVKLIAHAALLSGLWAAQRDDYPITVKSGHSLSELILAPEEIRHADTDRPDSLLVLTEDGLKKSHRFLARMTADQTVFTPPGFADLDTAATIVVLDPQAAEPAVPRTDQALALLSAAVIRSKVLDVEALEAAAAAVAPSRAEGNLRAVRAGIRLAAHLD